MATINQLGFFLVAAAVYDTFVSRCILTPAIMSIFGNMNWWPGPLFSALRENQLQEEVKLRHSAWERHQQSKMGRGGFDHIYEVVYCASLAGRGQPGARTSMMPQ